MSETKINDLRINKGLTKQQLIDSTVITENELSFVTDDSVVDVPTPTEAGKVLTSTEDGVEWSEGGSGGDLPDQTGNAGKFLMTDGTNASWESRPEYSEYSTDSITFGLKNPGYMFSTIAFGKNIMLPMNSSSIVAIGAEIQSRDYVPSDVGSGSIVVGIKAGSGGTDNVIIGSGYVNGSDNITIGKAEASRMLTSTKKMVVRSYDTDYELLDLQTGQIPAERLANTIGDINALLDSINGEVA